MTHIPRYSKRREFIDRSSYTKMDAAFRFNAAYERCERIYAETPKIKSATDGSLCYRRVFRNLTMIIMRGWIFPYQRHISFVAAISVFLEFCLSLRREYGRTFAREELGGDFALSTSRPFLHVDSLRVPELPDLT